MQTIHVRLDDAGGNPWPKPVLESIYVSDLEFEPDERRQRILSDGTVELTITKSPYMVHAKLTLPLYGNIWVTADNEGQGYTGDFVDFITEAANTYLAHSARLGEGLELPPAVCGHIEAAKELLHLANRGNSTPENRLYALSHAIYGAEGSLFAASQKKAFANPRDDLLLGCNFHRFISPGARYAKFFKHLFNFATLPFYPGRTVPQEGQYQYEYIDQALGFLEQNHIKAKGHPLWFGHSEVNPQWLKEKNYEQLRVCAKEIAMHHVERYRGRIQIWDAMNEAHDWANCFGLTQPQLIELTRICCDALHETNDKAQAIVNICLPFAEYVAGRYTCYGSLPEHLRSPLHYFRDLLEAGVNFDVVGIQLYFPARDMVMVNRLLDVFSSLGKPIHITEMGADGGTRTPSGHGGKNWPQLSHSEGIWHGGWNETTQADWMEQFYTLAASRPEIKALTWWDFIEPSFSGNGAFLYEDENPREIYFRLMALKERIIKSKI